MENQNLTEAELRFLISILNKKMHKLDKTLDKYRSNDTVWNAVISRMKLFDLITKKLEIQAKNIKFEKMINKVVKTEK